MIFLIDFSEFYLTNGTKGLILGGASVTPVGTNKMLRRDKATKRVERNERSNKQNETGGQCFDKRVVTHCSDVGDPIERES